MNTNFSTIIVFLVLLMIGCTPSYESDGGVSEPIETGETSQAGLVTAGEWNDLENWSFWKNLLVEDDFSMIPDYWGFYTNRRVSIKLQNENQALINVKLELFDENNDLEWVARTDNLGKAEMWINLYQPDENTNISDFSLKVDGQTIDTELHFIEDGVVDIEYNNGQVSSSQVELAFIVDATSSMSDELEFLKDDLENVINSLDNESLSVFTSSVFYRDEGDQYVVRKSNFSPSLETTIDFINNQFASGGGDYPEALHSALNVGIEELSWTENARTRIAFLLLDAPPHYETEILEEIRYSVKEASQKGIKIIPIAASGISKETEFLLRYFSICTNSTYVFITDDSGIGNKHLTPSVGDYEVEYLNDLIVRLTNKYTE